MPARAMKASVASKPAAALAVAMKAAKTKPRPAAAPKKAAHAAKVRQDALQGQARHSHSHASRCTVSVRTPQDLGKALQRAVAGLVLVAQWHGGCAMDKAEGPDLLDPHTTIGEVHGCRSHRHDVRAPVCTTIDCSVAELVFHKKESCRAGDRQQQLTMAIGWRCMGFFNNRVGIN